MDVLLYVNLDINSHPVIHFIFDIDPIHLVRNIFGNDDRVLFEVQTDSWEFKDSVAQDDTVLVYIHCDV